MAYTGNLTPDGLDAKATPIDADVAVVGDSADSNRVKQTTFAQLRTWVEAFTSYFNVTSDTLDDITDGATYVKSTNDYTTTEKNKLSAIEASADVTDNTNVNAAGATMDADTSLAGNGYFLDEDDMTSDDATKVASQQSIKAHVATEVATVSASSLLDYDKAPTAISGTTSEITMWSKSIGAGVLGTGNIIKGRMYVPVLTGDTSDTLTLRLKYGSTTVVTYVSSTIPTTGMVGYIDFFLAADASASAQTGRIFFNAQKTDAADIEIGTAAGTATEASAGALTMSLTGQWSGVSSVFTPDDVIVELLKA